MHPKLLLSILVLLILSAAGAAFLLRALTMNENTNLKVISFQTSDGVNISADFWSGTNGSAVVLAHMLSRDRGVWGDFPMKLQEKGYTVLNLDLRGHGKSITQNGQAIHYQNFTDADFAKMPLDLAAAKKYLIATGIDPTKVSFIGASIGANAALVAAAQDPQVRSTVLLSPGENYHGVQTFTAAHAYAGRPALIFSSSEDLQSYQPSQQMTHFIGPSAKFVGLTNAGHGTDMFDHDPNLENQIISFLQTP